MIIKDIINLSDDNNKIIDHMKEDLVQLVRSRKYDEAKKLADDIYNSEVNCLKMMNKKVIIIDEEAE